jgi:hypothetical protein
LIWLTNNPMKLAIRAVIALLLLSMAESAYPCDVITVGPLRTTADYVRAAQAIVRVKARAQATIPEGPSFSLSGEPTARIVFDVVEVLKGRGLGAELTLPGFLTESENFNEGAVPYTDARGTRRGPCFADYYQSGGEFLLLLVRRPSGEYTARWAALRPLNEQIRGSGDPWLLWIRSQLK